LARQHNRLSRRDNRLINAGSLEGFDKDKVWCNISSVGVSGQEDAPWKMSRRAFLHARDPARCLHGCAGRFFDNLMCQRTATKRGAWAQAEDKLKLELQTRGRLRDFTRQEN
jgi:hypothetical protein